MKRGAIDEAIAAGLVAQRAQGLEPSPYAKALALKVSSGEISLSEMEELLLKHHGLSKAKSPSLKRAKTPQLCDKERTL